MSIEWMQVLHWGAIFAAGFFAGGINVIVGAGTLVSFPLLVLLGFPPLTATIANTIGIVPGSATGVAVYRKELLARGATVRMLLPASVLGAIGGASLLLHFSAGVFRAVIPWLIAFGTLLVLAGPTIKRYVGQGKPESASGLTRPHELPFATPAVVVVSVVGAFLLGIYGGYFSAAPGILLIALLGITSSMPMQELNAIKTLKVAVVNVIAASVFIVRSPELISWPTVALIAVGATVGGIVGGRFARRLRPDVFRVFVVTVGVDTVVAMMLQR